MNRIITAIWKALSIFRRTDSYPNNFINWFNYNFEGGNAFVIDLDSFPVVVGKDGFYYFAEKNIFTVTPFYHNYKLPEIFKEDIVVDIGANIGVFTMLAASAGAKVIAVEPITTCQLKRNLELNSLKATVIKAFIGSKCQWWGKLHDNIDTISFKEIKNQYGCTVLKSNCEGGEWSIDPKDLEEVRAVEIEFHFTRGVEINQELYDYVINNYKTDIKDYGTSHWVSGIRE